MSNMQIQVVKQLFDVFIDRTLAYNYNNHIGLITFDNRPKVKQGITSIIEDFRSSVKDETSGTHTSLWDALNSAKTELTAYGLKHPSARKRIVCLTDGEDNLSIARDYAVCSELQVCIPYYLLLMTWFLTLLLIRFKLGIIPLLL
jgi:Mg-chelatase subunit ChlD